MKKISIFGVVLLVVTFYSSFVFGISSTNYAINNYATSGGGGTTSSTNYNTDVILGTVAGNMVSSNYNNYLGFYFGSALLLAFKLENCLVFGL